MGHVGFRGPDGLAHESCRKRSSIKGGMEMESQGGERKAERGKEGGG
jgi:hypothetical protein